MTTYDGRAFGYLEFATTRSARSTYRSLSGQAPTGAPLEGPARTRADKAEFGRSRIQRFGQQQSWCDGAAAPCPRHRTGRPRGRRPILEMDRERSSRRRCCGRTGSRRRWRRLLATTDLNESCLHVGPWIPWLEFEVMRAGVRRLALGDFVHVPVFTCISETKSDRRASWSSSSVGGGVPTVTDAPRDGNRCCRTVEHASIHPQHVGDQAPMSPHDHLAPRSGTRRRHGHRGSRSSALEEVALPDPPHGGVVVKSALHHLDPHVHATDPGCPLSAHPAHGRTAAPKSPSPARRASGSPSAVGSQV